MNINLDLNLIILLSISFLLIICIILLIVLLAKNGNKNNFRYYFKNEIDNLETKLVKNDNDNFVKIIEKNNKNSISILEMIQKNLNQIRDENEKKLNIIQYNINDKLDKSLNERLDNSFKTISDQLVNLHSSLGELQSLSSGVMSLNKTLSNVKTTGIFGEEQLKSILENVLSRDQYEVQFKISNDNNRIVDYAIKIPNKDGSGFIYLPIDCKFPISHYEKLLDAYNENDAKKIEKERIDLKNKIINDAKSISEKYINVPITTEFAIMFLPTESLFCECLNIKGLNEELRNKYSIIISGPTTISALINSLSIGFRFLQINKSSRKVYDILNTIKKQYELFGEEIKKAQNSINSAKEATDKIEKRNDMINNKLKKIEISDSIEENDIMNYIEENA